MKQVLKALSVALILAGTMLAQQEVAPEVYPDKSPAAAPKTVAAKQQPKKAVVAQKHAVKATLVAAKTTAKPAAARSN